MQESLLQAFKTNPQMAIAISLFISILIAVVGVLPSVFITAANILFFGFWNGTLLSFLGEAIGAGIAFILYRKGFKKIALVGLSKYPTVKKLIDAPNNKAFYLIVSLRLIPFVPSGFITFAAAIGKVSFSYFLIASSVGKIPALLMEAWSVQAIIQFNWQGKLVLLLVGIGLLFWVVKQVK